MALTSCCTSTCRLQGISPPQPQLSIMVVLAVNLSNILPESNESLCSIRIFLHWNIVIISHEVVIMMSVNKHHVSIRDRWPRWTACMNHFTIMPEIVIWMLVSPYTLYCNTLTWTWHGHFYSTSTSPDIIIVDTWIIWSIPLHHHLIPGAAIIPIIITMVSIGVRWKREDEITAARCITQSKTFCFLD